MTKREKIFSVSFAVGVCIAVVAVFNANRFDSADIEDCMAKVGNIETCKLIKADYTS